MSSLKTLFRFALIALAAFALSGCGGADTPTSIPGNVACWNSTGCYDYGYVSDAPGLRAACTSGGGFTGAGTSCSGGGTCQTWSGNVCLY